MYKALSFFTDKTDGGRPYEKDDVYPRAGLKPSAERIAELLGYDNDRHVPVIVEIKENKPIKAAKTEAVEEIPTDFMNPPENGDSEAVEQPKKRGRKKKDA